MRRTVLVLSITTAASLSYAGIAEAATAPQHFRNCTAMHQKYTHGVGKPGATDKGNHRPRVAPYRNTKLYNANSGLDRDHDGIACEA